MGRPVVLVLYVLALVAVVVGVDAPFFRDHAWEQLTVNVGIVLVFAAFYFRLMPLSQAPPPPAEGVASADVVGKRQ